MSAAQTTATSKQSFQLKNYVLELVLDHPLSSYAYSRFDWTGKIVSVKYKGVEICSVENSADKTSNCIGKGFYNEFGIQSAIGFDEIEKGQWFPKIGIGLLKKVTDIYDFSAAYKIKPAKFKVVEQHNQLLLECHQEAHMGYAYVLTKKIQLNEMGFSINYCLQNKGSKTISTNEYNHNFISLAKKKMDRDILLTFPFTVNPKLFVKTVNPENLVEINEGSFSFKGTPKEQFFFENISGTKSVNAAWELINQENNIGIRETANFKTSAINLWGWQQVICPELFYEIKLKPGAVKNWTRTYEIFNIHN